MNTIVTDARPSTPRISRPGTGSAAGPVFGLLFAISFCHLINDMLQSLLPAVYPILAGRFRLSYGQVGLITLTFQAVGSLLQPAIGLYTDRRPKPYSLPIGMASTLVGLIVLAHASSFHLILVGAALVGLGSAVFHPESSRVARLASGGRHGMAQSIFQVGGNAGTAIGPVLAATIILHNGQKSIAWFAAAALLGLTILARISAWYQGRLKNATVAKRQVASHGIPQRQVARALAVLAVLVFSKFVYMASLTNYYTFYLIHRFGLSVRDAQLHLFLFLGAVAVGTFAGGPIGDRIGRKRVIWASILGVLPFSLALPYAGLTETAVLTVIIGLILSSAFSTIIVFAQELAPGRVGAISGLFFGLAFGMGGLGAAGLGLIADRTSLDFVYRLCSVLPALGLLTALLPNLNARRT
jgi:FSR family fosmidomycin resistance protein-like MFS transporter